MPSSDSFVLWKALKGIICVYKPAEISVNNLRKKLITKLCTDFSELDVKLRYSVPAESTLLSIRNNSDSTALAQQNVETSLTTVNLNQSVIKSLDLKYHPAVIGPRYRDEDLFVSWSNYLGWNTSGVLLFGLGYGTKLAKFIRENRSTRAYRINGAFGKATDNGFHNGKVVERSTWKYIKPGHLQKILSSMQASHQKKMYEACGVDLNSQMAYDLAVKGPIRPVNSKIPIIYGLKCIDYEGPDFTIEVQCINENEIYLTNLIHEIGLKLHSTAHTKTIKCIRHSCFTLEHALLQKHWNLHNVTQNMDVCNKLLAENEEVLNQSSAVLREGRLGI